MRRSRWRWRWRGATIITALLGIATAHAACPLPAAGTAVVRGVDASGVMVLTDGRRVVLAGIAIERSAIPALAALSVGRTVVLHPLPRPRDRWNRLVAGVDLVGPRAGRESLEGLLLRRGLGHAAALGHGVCLQQLLADEAVARTAHLGVWRKPGYVLAATDVAALSRHLGEHVVASGRVVSVRLLRTRAYVNFAHRRGEGLSVMVRKRAWSRNGIGAAGVGWLAGRRLRVRGHLEWQGGPLIELTDEEPLERLD